MLYNCENRLGHALVLGIDAENGIRTKITRFHLNITVRRSRQSGVNPGIIMRLPSGEPKYRREFIYQWLDNIREMGIRQAFVPDHTERW